MELRTRRLLFVFGGALSFAFVGLVACNSGNDLLELPQAQDSGTSTSSPRKDASSDDDTPGAADAGHDCAAAPAVKSYNDIFCNKNDAGATLYCSPVNDAGGAGSVCCGDAQDSAGKFVPSSCASAGSCTYPGSPTGGHEWRCTESRHCRGNGQVCCLLTGSSGGAAGKIGLDKTYGVCGAYYYAEYKGVTIGGTDCKTTCDDGEPQLCGTDEECGDGMYCAYLSVNSHRTGWCKPVQ